MKKLLFVAVAFAGLALVSCNKDQSAVNKMEGTWNATEMTQTSNGVTVDLLDNGNNSVTTTMNKCKLKTDEWCTGTTTSTFGSVSWTDNFVYRVSGDGTVLEQKEHADSSDVYSVTIVELTKKMMTTTDTEGNVTTDAKFEKQ